MRFFRESLATTLLLGATPAMANCVSIIADAGLGQNRAVNNCPYPVIGKFCYEQGSWLRCGNSSGGFKIAANGFEVISKPQNHTGPYRWRISECPLNEWNAGRCRLLDP